MNHLLIIIDEVKPAVSCVLEHQVFSSRSKLNDWLIDWCIRDWGARKGTPLTANRYSVIADYMDAFGHQISWIIAPVEIDPASPIQATEPASQEIADAVGNIQ